MSSCAFHWISTHYRTQARFNDELPHLVRQYNEEMRTFIENGKCGKNGYIDVFNMTEQLGLHHGDDAVRLTHDGAHWGMEVNMVKVQVILNTLLN